MSHTAAAAASATQDESGDLPLLRTAQYIDHATEIVGANGRRSCGEGSNQLVLSTTLSDNRENMLNPSAPDFLQPDPDLLSPSLGSSHGSLRQRRKSPVTVQEWVASLPPPHVLQRQNFVSADLEDNHVAVGSTLNGGLGTSSNRTNGEEDLQVKGQLASGEPQFIAQTLQKGNE